MPAFDLGPHDTVIAGDEGLGSRRALPGLGDPDHAVALLPAPLAGHGVARRCLGRLQGLQLQQPGFEVGPGLGRAVLARQQRVAQPQVHRRDQLRLGRGAAHEAGHPVEHHQHRAGGQHATGQRHDLDGTGFAPAHQAPPRPWPVNPRIAKALSMGIHCRANGARAAATRRSQSANSAAGQSGQRGAAASSAWASASSPASPVTVAARLSRASHSCSCRTRG
mmetsp:Transcript_10638/g.43600  ORF Transcript_10638/g.43600 Transcript_10638/m.43600 type:complete len:222 (+) Transcript_10638:213-878(+)